MPNNSQRRRDKSTKRSDALVGYVIPLVFVFLAAYQQVTAGHVDQLVLGGLMVFGLGALGWRIDTAFEKYLDYRAGKRSGSNDDEDD